MCVIKCIQRWSEFTELSMERLAVFLAVNTVPKFNPPPLSPSL